MKYIFRQQGINPSKEAKLGTLFTLSNGRIAWRGEHELSRSNYGLLISNIYDYAPIFYREIVVFPRPINLEIHVNGAPLNVYSKNASIERILDIGKGALLSRIKWNNNYHNVVYKSIRFVHKKRKNIIGFKAYISTKNEAEIIIRNTIDLRVSNPLIPSNISIQHFRIKSEGDLGNGVYALFETIDEKYKVGMMVSLHIKPDGKRYYISNNHYIGEQYVVWKNKEPIQLEGYVCITRNLDYPDPLTKSIECIKEITSNSWNRLYKEHSEEWRKIWNDLGLRIKGDKTAERKLKFNIFHLLQLGDDEAEKLILPAKGLHGIGYRGHMFWDTEIFTLPFYVLVKPSVARAILMFRYATLEQAKDNARRNRYKGAQYPWEASDDGVEATPREIPLDPIGKEKIRIWTGDEEHHISADIAYAIDYYYKVTGDEDFMAKYGLEMLIEIARFWASRVEFEDGKGYVIKKVIGPDEYHIHVNNSFYTNLMAKHSLMLAVKYYYMAMEKKGSWIDTLVRTKVSNKEISLWKNIAENLYLPCKTNGLCEEFDGYFNLEDYIVNENCIGEKCLPPEIVGRIDKTRLVKQADVVLALFLMHKVFDKEIIEKNFKYYIKRTVHGSSLSLPIYAGLAAFLGDTDLAYKLFMLGLGADLEDLYGNTEDGLHMGSLGGLWQAFVNGFLGLDVNDENISIHPRLPRHWRKVLLNIKIKGRRYRIIVEKGKNVILERI